MSEKSKYRIRNWKDYNRSLVQNGRLPSEVISRDSDVSI